ncbi:MAG: MvdD family ATP-grasp ribosomal peptide maturase, partial [Patescibacteria group bacterium]
CNGRIAVKCIRQRVFSNDDGTHNGIYTNIVNIADLVESKASLSVCPVMLQEYIEKKIELRITIVGKQVFACAIHSQDEVRTMIDWRRYGEKWVKHEVFVLPEHVKGKLLESMKSWGIVFGAIDMIVTPENNYVFLEVNPSGQYGWIEGLTGMPISRAIAEVLSNPNV